MLHVPAHALKHAGVDSGQVGRGLAVAECGDTQLQLVELYAADAEVRHAGDKSEKVGYSISMTNRCWIFATSMRIQMDAEMPVCQVYTLGRNLLGFQFHIFPTNRYYWSVHTCGG